MGKKEKMSDANRRATFRHQNLFGQPTNGNLCWRKDSHSAKHHVAGVWGAQLSKSQSENPNVYVQVGEIERERESGCAFTSCVYEIGDGRYDNVVEKAILFRRRRCSSSSSFHFIYIHNGRRSTLLLLATATNNRPPTSSKQIYSTMESKPQCHYLTSEPNSWLTQSIFIWGPILPPRKTTFLLRLGSTSQSVPKSWSNRCCCCY